MEKAQPFDFAWTVEERAGLTDGKAWANAPKRF